MDARRRPPRPPPSVSAVHHHHQHRKAAAAADEIHGPSSPVAAKASDALPLPLYLTNAVFFTLFFSVAYYLLHRWRDKIRTSTPLHVLNFSEITAIVALIASFIYLLGFFGIDFVQSFISRTSNDAWDLDDPAAATASTAPDHRSYLIRPPPPCAAAESDCDARPPSVLASEEDEEIVKSVVEGTLSSYSLESRLGNCKRAAAIRREALQRTTGRSLQGLPLEDFDYESILGQCCEMPVGYVQIPVGIAGPLLLDGFEYSVPMATTEGCLVASTNRGCKAIHLSGGATSVLLRDAMTRAPVVRFGSAKRASDLKFYMEDPANFDTLAVVFNRYLLFFSFPLLLASLPLSVSLICTSVFYLEIGYFL